MALSNDEVDAMRKAFDEVDCDSSGKLAPGEIWDVLKKVNLEVVKDKADEILLTMDTGGDGEIGFDEFLAFTMALKVGAWASGAAATPTMFSVFGKAMGSLADSFVDVTVSVGNEMANVGKSKAELNFEVCAAKMRAEGLSEAAIKSFQHSYLMWANGTTDGTIPETSIAPITELPTLAEITSTLSEGPDTSLLKETVVLKLNGGLGTSMGLDFAKSLLPVKSGDNFLDLTAKQVMHLRATHSSKDGEEGKTEENDVKFLVMNSFNTSEDTMTYLQNNYPELASDPTLEVMQNKVPKIDAATGLPGDYSSAPRHEWCPPGHGDLYAALEGSGTLDKLLADGFKYLFVSNSDNLGATLNLDLLTYFAQRDDLSFLMECCERTVNDKKGGHLCMAAPSSSSSSSSSPLPSSANAKLMLREAAQCAPEDEEAFQDVQKHMYFNTNNLWLRLDKLKEAIAKNKGFLPLPMIKNAKTIDPKDASSTPVVQLETAMGAAIECFPGASAAVRVPRSRFVPVKKCSDLLLLRSDCYCVTPHSSTVVLSPGVTSLPEMALDGQAYKFVEALDLSLTLATPSLKLCSKLDIRGFVIFSPLTTLKGSVVLVNSSGEARRLPSGTYENCTVDLTLEPSVDLSKLAPPCVPCSFLELFFSRG